MHIQVIAKIVVELPNNPNREWEQLEQEIRETIQAKKFELVDVCEHEEL